MHLITLDLGFMGSKIFTAREDFLGCGLKNEGVLPLGHVAALRVHQWRVRVDNAVLDEISQGQDVAGTVQLLQPTFSETESAVLDSCKITF